MTPPKDPLEMWQRKNDQGGATERLRAIHEMPSPGQQQRKLEDILTEQAFLAALAGDEPLIAALKVADRRILQLEGERNRLRSRLGDAIYQRNAWAMAMALVCAVQFGLWWLS